MKNFLPPVLIRTSLYDALAQQASDCLHACRVTASDGTVIFRPDGGGHYDAMWTRDLAYMIEGAGHLMDPAEILAAIDYLLAGQREDGVIPDRRTADGRSIYLAGPEDKPLGGDPPTDNAQFIVKALDAYVILTRDVHAFLERRHALYRAVESVPVTEDWLVYIDPNRPHSEYGFTDCVAKTGEAFFTTALYWEACQRLARLCARSEVHDEAHEWYEHSEATSRHIQDFYDEQTGMYLAASQWCPQVDLWASVYAAVVRVASKAQARRIAEYLLANWEGAVYSGHLRHLPGGEYWHRMLLDIPRGTYQNGGFWATPAGWLAQTIALVDEAAARSLIDTIADEFATNGVHEWISPETRALPGYAASITNVLGACAPAKKLEP